MSGCIRMPEPKVAIALLAAGQAERFGGGKLDALCAGKPLGAWAAQAVEAAKCAFQLVVVPTACPAFAKELKGWSLVTNTAPEEGIAGSIRIAATAAQGFSRLVIALADMPLINTAHLRALAAADGIVFTAYPDGDRGVPAAFPARCFGRLIELKGSAARLDWGEEITLFSPPSPQSLLDVDTADDLTRTQALLIGE